MIVYGEALEIVELVQIVHEILDDNKKTALWLSTPNPHLGEVPPLELILMGRGYKALKFARTCQDENAPLAEKGE